MPCEFMSSANGKQEANDILRRIRNTGQQQPGDEEIKILFVTPERVAKSKSLLAALQKAYERRRLARIVIDEAHCCSNQGHDFRPDYRKLSILRKVFPETKCTCLTATCSPSVLQDVLKILGMPATTEPTCAWANRTVYFTAPLHRPNLVYKVLPRPSSSNAANQAICDWILEHHPEDTGIVYCLSKKDTETMAQQLSELSQGRIKTGCYHADVDDAQKHRIHLRWREGRIRVVCATIAFGMGIDKPDVRFVMHSGISKSLEGYYQESGRAGRDGNRSDCVLLYRPQDASRLASLVAGEPTGREKLGAMLEYAQSTRCRKIIFGEYFEDAFQDNAPCGQCDNCADPPHDRDVSFQAWQIVNAMQDMWNEGGRVTVANLADLVRGLKGGQYTIVAGGGGGGGKKRKSRAGGAPAGVLDMERYGGKITDLSSDDVERVVVHLLNRQYLADDYNATAYSVNVYVAPGNQAIRLTRQTLDAARNLSGIALVNLSSSSSGTKRGGKARKSAGAGAGASKGGASGSSTPAPAPRGKKPAQAPRKGKGKNGAGTVASAPAPAPAADDIDTEEEGGGGWAPEDEDDGEDMGFERDDVDVDAEEYEPDPDEEAEAYAAEMEMADFIVDDDVDVEPESSDRGSSSARKRGGAGAGSGGLNGYGFGNGSGTGRGRGGKANGHGHGHGNGIELDDEGWEVMPLGLAPGLAPRSGGGSASGSASRLGSSGTVRDEPIEID